MDSLKDVENILREASERKGVLSFAGGFPAVELFPNSILADAALEALDSQEKTHSLQYGWPEGESWLRRWIADRLRARGAEVDPDEVVITAGAQQALSLAVECLVGPGARVRVDAHSYPGALELFRAQDAVLQEHWRGADCAYVMPGPANPLGVDLLEGQLSTLLEQRCPIIADEAYTETQFDGHLPRPLLGRIRERVWHIGTVSKTLCPGLRVGWLIPPSAELETIKRHKQLRDLQTGTFTQTLLIQAMQELDYDAHLRRSRTLYAERARAMAEGLRSLFPEWSFAMPEGGFSIWIETRYAGPENAFLRLALEQGVVFDPGALYFAEPEDQPLSLRLCFSRLAPGEIQEALWRLRRAWEGFLAEKPAEIAA